MQYPEHPVVRTLLWSGMVLLFLYSLWTGGISAAEPDYMTAMGIVPFDGDIDAPDFTLPTVDGQPLRLTDLQGKVILLNFWATW
ncbi:hypothetical protein NKDENANG_02064 [Candidatus Entotheonellaceae bacterium PAL068K]